MTPSSKTLPENPVLIDTPVWQDYFRKKELTFQKVNALMDAGRVCSLDFVVAELLQVAQNEREAKVFQDFIRIFPVLQESSPGKWIEAARLAFKLRQKGNNLPLRDCYIAVMASSNHVLLYTTNKFLIQSAKAMAIGLIFFRMGGLTNEVLWRDMAQEDSPENLSEDKSTRPRHT